jgi:hypothetical protein
VLWPPQLDDVKADIGRKRENTAGDADLQVVLDAAVALVERELAGSYNFTGSTTSLLPTPTPDVFLGTVRLAGRWNERRNSPNGLIDLGELGQTRIPTVDPDIERLLGVGRWRPPMVL